MRSRSALVLLVGAIALALPATGGGARWRGARGAGRVRELDHRQQAGSRHVRGDPVEGLVHAVRRRAERGLLPPRGHRPGAVAGVRGDRREHVRRPRERGHRPAGAAGGSPRAGLRAGQHGPVRPLPDHQDLRHRPGAVDRPAAGPLRPHCSRATTRCSSCTTRRSATPPSATPRRGPGGRRRGAAHQRGRHPRGPGRLGRLPAHLQRLRRHQRRLDRPRGRPAARLRLRHRDGRQRPADRRAPVRAADHHPHAWRSASPAPTGRPTGGARQPRRRLRRPRGRVPGGVAPLSRLAPSGPGGALRPAAHAVQRRGHDGQGARGQDLPRRLHRLADAAVGLRRERRRRRRWLPLRLGARPLPPGDRPARRR